MQDDKCFKKRKTINIKGKILNIYSPMVMGILNITPDSFYDGGKYNKEDDWINRTAQMIDQGAEIIDIGAVSTRPGSKILSCEEELQRLIPVLDTLVSNFNNIIISADTYRAEVAKTAVEHGAAIINDISGGDMDKDMFSTIAELNVPYIMMHIQGTPENMQDSPQYKNVVKEIIMSFALKINELRSLGVNDIIIDPGFGFGKDLDHNYQLLAGLKELQCFELPIMVGVSRKSLINKVLKTKPENALNGTTVLNTIALINGADILRVHDVKEAVEIIKLFKVYNKEDSQLP